MARVVDETRWSGASRSAPGHERDSVSPSLFQGNKESQVRTVPPHRCQRCGLTESTRHRLASGAAVRPCRPGGADREQNVEARSDHRERPLPPRAIRYDSRAAPNTGTTESEKDCLLLHVIRSTTNVHVWKGRGLRVAAVSWTMWVCEGARSQGELT